MENKYITILEMDNSECPNVGTLSVEPRDTLEDRFKEAIEAHFDDEMVGYAFDKPNINRLDECIGGYPIDVKVLMGEKENTYTVELTHTWLY